MALFADRYAKHLLQDNFSKDWPSSPEKMKEVMLGVIEEEIQGRQEKKENFLFYFPEDNKFKKLDYEEAEVEGHRSGEILKAFIKNPRLAPSFFNNHRKRIGSTKGLGSFFPFVIGVDNTTKTGGKSGTEKKIKKTISALRENYAGYSESFIEIFENEDFVERFIEQIEDFEGYFIIFASDEGYAKFFSAPNFIQNTINRTGSKKTNCQICGAKNEYCGYPILGNSFASGKEFLRSPTKGSGRISICGNCGFKIFIFNKLLKSWGRILPLFIHPEAAKISIDNILSLNNKNSAYRETMDMLYEKFKDEEDKLSHYLVVSKNDEYLVDYVSSIKWKVPWVENVFEHCSAGEKNKKDIGNEFSGAIGKKNVDLAIFHKEEKREQRQTTRYKEEKGEQRQTTRYLTYAYAERIYSFVYLGQNSIVFPDMLDITNLAVYDKYLSGTSERHKTGTICKNMRKCLELFFNSKNICKVENMVELNKLRETLKKIRKDEEIKEICPEEWAYAAGSFYRYLCKQSKSENKTLQLEQIANISYTEDLQKLLSRMMERYGHEIKESYLKIWGGISSVALAGTKEKRKFEELKPYFYSGVVDNFAENEFYGGEKNE